MAEPPADRLVYLDGHATTPLAPEAEAAMAPWWRARVGNPHSPHRRGFDAARAVEAARAQVAGLVGADPQEVVFTSGATEANNLALIGVGEAALTAGDQRREVVLSAVEHRSVQAAGDALRRRGFSVRLAPVTPEGVIDLQALRSLVSVRTLLVSAMAANNEVGSVQPIADVLEAARAVGAMVHVDAAQLAGKLPFDASGFDFVSLSAHKLYGPMGVGALFVSSAAEYRPAPLWFGGTQERGLRPGTLPTPLLVGFGAAADLAALRLVEDARHGAELSGRLLAGLTARQTRFVVNVPAPLRLPGSLSLRLPGTDAGSLVAKLSSSVCLSDGSACSSGQIVTSHVLAAMQLSPEAASETIRLYCSRYNTSDEIDFAADRIARAVREDTLAPWMMSPVGFPDEEPARRV